MLKLLPFSALRTFESVVRLSGFGRAAEELSVTQSAVSQHIRALEEWTGHKLLIRGARKTVPTEKGLHLALAVAEGFGAVQAVCDELRDRSEPKNQMLLVASPPGFAFVWLLPRLMEFDQLHPDIPISLSTDVFARDFRADSADLVIQYSSSSFTGLHSERIIDELMTPVCAPSLADQFATIDDLRNHTMLQDDVIMPGVQSTWHLWADEVGIKLPRPASVRKFGQANMVVQAAKEGMGVAMGRSPLVGDAIAKGELVCPVPMVAQSRNSYWLVCRHDTLKTERAQLFRDWLLRQIADQPPLPHELTDPGSVTP